LGGTPEDNGNNGNNNDGKEDGNNNGDGNNGGYTKNSCADSVDGTALPANHIFIIAPMSIADARAAYLRSDDGLGTSVHVALDDDGRILVVGAPRADNLAGSSALDTAAAFVQTLVNANNGNFSNTALGKGVAKLVASDAHRWTYPEIIGE